MNLRNIKSSNIASLRSAFCCRVSSPLSHPSNSQQSAACEATFVRFHGFYFSNSQQYTGTNRSADCRWKTQCVAGRQTSPLKPAMPEIKSVIELTDTEQKLFEELLESSKKAGLNETTLRCAGGWVRDKLMGRESLDIDIALDNMLGKEFADTVNQYLESHGKETHNVAVIMSNPDQSKHLETARMKIRGLWIDLVNLRSEEYAHNSRIPTMSFGTPEQDAFRRDFTINSLFYNINEGTIEDLTGRGVEDMKLGIIRTPLPAKETFLDDPLRVLRAVRFASRFGFSLDESLIEAASDSKVRDMLGHKVSRERIGTELDGMINGPDPLTALDLLRSMGLFEAVFEVHPSATEDVTTAFALAGSRLGKSVCNMLMNWEGVFDGHPGLNLHGKDARRQTILGALLLPLRYARVPTTKNKMQSMSSHIIRDSLKWKSKDAEVIDLLHTVAPKLVTAYGSLLSMGVEEQGTASRLKIQLGRCVKQLKDMWPSGLFLACLLCSKEAAPLGVEDAVEEIAPWGDEGDGGSTLPAVLSSSLADVPDLHEHMEMCKSLEAAIKAYEIHTCWQWRPLLNGKEVMQTLEMTQGGPLLGVAMDSCFDYQLVNPRATKEDCREWLVQNKDKVLNQDQDLW